MPHKRNPELSERVCGLARVVRGHAVTALENVALWGERDISHSSAERIILPDSCMAIDYMLSLFAGVITDLRVYPERMQHNLESTKGVVFSQRVMLAMVEQGAGREQAYATVHRLSMESSDGGKDFRNLARTDPEVGERLNSTELEDLFDYQYYIRYVDDIFSGVGLIEEPESRPAETEAASAARQHEEPT